MANDSQGRSALSLAVQQHDNKPAATLVSSQFARLATADFTPDPELDEFPVNTTDGSITATMKAGRLCYAGKAYTFRKKAAANTLTIAFSNSETFEGASTIAVTDDDAVVSIMWDPVSLEWVRATAAGVGGDVPAGVAAIDGSNITGADLTAFKTKIAAVFGNVAYDIADNIEVALALRYDREKRDGETNVPRVLAPIASIRSMVAVYRSVHPGVASRVSSALLILARTTFSRNSSAIRRLRASRFLKWKT